MADIQKIHIFGHSFVKRLKQFIQDSDDLKFNLDLNSRHMVQYTGFSGATIMTLRQHLDQIEDFAPDLVVLVIGTNDLCDASMSSDGVANQLMDLVDTLLFVIGVPKVIVTQILHRTEGNIRSKHWVDIDWFNNRVDKTNIILSTLDNKPHHRSKLWRLKGFWTVDTKAMVYAQDGCHLSPTGNMKLYRNLRAAVVASMNCSVLRV
ncbi:uncharacterized protein LOC123523618 [Mercenaria mercenaria]|uniref:uncharacterized protein LOC123523618 n=1 Tax=Mercenaria mercenaria TaxID=6596 RepID=UPI00234F29AE|nr:uncharacterized protein LOC123523618 [Mercenaria mercenaria]